MVESSAFDYKMKYTIKNVKDGNYIQIYNDTIVGLGADGIKGVPHGYDATLFRINQIQLRNGMHDDEQVVSIEHFKKYINRWHGGD